MQKRTDSTAQGEIDNDGNIHARRDRNNEVERKSGKESRKVTSVFHRDWKGLSVGAGIGSIVLHFRCQIPRVWLVSFHLPPLEISPIDPLLKLARKLGTVGNYSEMVQMSDRIGNWCEGWRMGHLITPRKLIKVDFVRRLSTVD